MKAVATVVSPTAYWSSVALAALVCAGACLAARRRPGRWTVIAARLIGVLLLADAVSYTVGVILQGTWSAKTSLPLALCDVGVLVAAGACWWRRRCWSSSPTSGAWPAPFRPSSRLTSTSDFPHLVFFQYVVGHPGIVLAALFLVVGMRIEPRPGAVRRVFAITLAYSAFVGVGRRPERRRLHVPAVPARRVDPPAAARALALVHR